MSRATRLVAAVAWMAVLWILSSIPTAPDQTTAGIFVPKVLQKTLHVIAYAMLSAAWLWVLDTGRSATNTNTHTGFMAIGLTTTYAAIDEFHQTFVPGRTGSPWDVALDACGAALAILAVAAVKAHVPVSGKTNHRGTERTGESLG